MTRATFIVALALLPHVTAAAELSKVPEARRARYLMGTVCEVAITGGDAESQIEAAFAEAERVERLLSTWVEGSELSRLNRGALKAPSAELTSLLERTADWSRRTGGAFDPRIKALIGAWKTRGEGALPDRKTLDAAMQDDQLEEGAFGKGYALDRMLAATSGDATIDFGGQILVRGRSDVGIADPSDRQRPVIAFTIENASLSTSSGSEKTFEIDGRRFSHILDPRTGEALPPRGSVSVISDDALTADILSTALYVMGEDDGLRWADANGVAAIFITTTHDIRLSARARERARDLTLLDRNFQLKD